MDPPPPPPSLSPVAVWAIEGGTISDREPPPLSSPLPSPPPFPSPGAVWANEAWGSYWSWDPKETWALITWLVYSFYLHTRLNKGWKGLPPPPLCPRTPPPHPVLFTGE